MKITEEKASWTVLADTRVASLAYRGRYGQIGTYFGRIFRQYGRFVTGAPLALYADPEYKEADASIEACVPIRAAAVTGKDGVEIKVLPGQRVVELVHRGAYDTLGESYKKAFDFLASQGARATTPSREVYLKGPGLLLPRNPKRYVTVIQIPAQE